MKNKGFLLASASPRRRELMKLICDEFDCVSCDIDETIPEKLSPADAVTALACAKAAAAAHLAEGRVVIAADTIVVLGDVIFGKPEDEEHAKLMLSLLSGRTHTVMTGVCIILPGGESVSLCEQTRVTFYELSAKQIADYVATGEPMDKAGAYGIQARGALLVKGIEGDYYNVIGFPIAHINRLLSMLSADE